MFYGVGSIVLSPGSGPTSKIQFFLTMYSGRSGMIYKIIVSSTQDNFGSPLPPRVACALNLLRVVRGDATGMTQGTKNVGQLVKTELFYLICV